MLVYTKPILKPGICNNMVTYISTRGGSPELGFEDVAIAGLAPDGGLYVPKTVPRFSPQEIGALAGLPYTELALRVMQPFVGDALSEDELRHLIHASYREFDHAAVAPLTQLNSNEWVMELFHGPTLAFKDFALQFLGRVLDHILTKRGERATVVGATSGDTGSAAIAGCRARASMDIFILHPKGRTSDVQRKQMTTVMDDNVHNIAIEGTFDDCQDIIKALFADHNFRHGFKLAAVNSINWVRILAQVVYYFHAALTLGSPAQRVSFSVPTGNFGDIFAGYIAYKMGLPIERLIIATNENDILARCVATGEYAMKGVHPTLSPSMDIQVSSNFERLLFDLYDQDANALNGLMTAFREKKSITLSPSALRSLRTLFSAASADDAQTKATIAEVYHETHVLLDPHTAVGVAAARKLRSETSTPIVTLATAHPAKFPDAVKSATGIVPALPDSLADLMTRKERFTVLPNSVDAVKKHIEKPHVM